MSEALSRRVRERPEGESVLDALERHFRGLVEDPRRPLAPRGAVRRFKPFIATLEASPALSARARLLMEHAEQELVKTLGEDPREPGDESTARLIAALVMSVVWRLLREFQTLLLRDEPEAKCRAALMRLGERGFELLRHGVGDVSRRRPRPSSSREGGPG